MLQITGLENYTYVRNKLSKAMRQTLPSRRDLAQASEAAQQQLFENVNRYLRLGRGRQKIQRYPYAKTQTERLLEAALQEDLTPDQRAEISAALTRIKTMPDAQRGGVDSQVADTSNRLHDRDWYSVAHYIIGDGQDDFDINELDDDDDLRTAMDLVQTNAADIPLWIQQAIKDEFERRFPEGVSTDETGAKVYDTDARSTVEKAAEAAQIVNRTYTGDPLPYADPKRSDVIEHYRKVQFGGKK